VETEQVLEALQTDPGFNQILSGWQQGLQVQSVHSLSGSIKAFYLAAGFRRLNRSWLVITAQEEAADRLLQDLRGLLGEEAVLGFSGEGLLPFEVKARGPEMTGQRLRVLQQLRTTQPRIMVATGPALNRRLMPRAVWEQLVLELREGDELDRQQLLQRLTEMSYEREEMAEAPGQFAARGGIVDVFPLTEARPLRIEIWEDRIQSLRSFDPVSQTSESAVEQALIVPAREIVAVTDLLAPARERLHSWGREWLLRLQREDRPRAAAHLQRQLNAGQTQLAAAGGMLDQVLGAIYPEAELIFDYLPPDTLICFDEYQSIQKEMEKREQEQAAHWEGMVEEGREFLQRISGLVTWQELIQASNRCQTLNISRLPAQHFPLPIQVECNFAGRELPRYSGMLESLAADIRRWQAEGFRVVLLVRSEEREATWQENLRSYGISPARERQPSLSEGELVFRRGGLSQGFEAVGARLVVLTETELAGRERRVRRQDKTSPGARLLTMADLRVGDYVVHINHGIGRYQGVERITMAMVQRDYLVIHYAGEDKLYVPTEQVELLQKYLGVEGAAPRLNRLGGNDWARVKARVKASVREVAEKLLALYASRQSRPGFRFSPDTVWQKEFEDSFPYEETRDQLQALIEIKQDMERERPMDRLLCGDVGYGKTEVAIRAAFKAVQDSKQVAVLVPTTVLAQQHYQTFQERLANYPVTVEVLSRFRTSREQKAVIERTRQGKVDILIGTHRLLSGDVGFRDLGLMIVDEEQRFGVMHKERLKELRSSVDVLTLTATPIPRTLHMAMVGVRDMSVIETPPEDRHPVQTYVVEYSPELVQEAIRRELDREGQVFYVHNRVKDLAQAARRIEKLVAGARLAIAHGQLPEEALEQAMLAFVEKRADILLCTSIIESGLDIPNVNTLIVEDADHLGLAQLYQLRGRVGRSNRIAYAYLTYRRSRVMTESAEKRLQTISEFTEFGAGFKIALRDLEIRGAGNLLGAEQHGHMAAVGFDMYTRLLEETIRELKGEELPAVELAPSLDLPIDAYIPDEYIADPRTKIDIYRRLMVVEAAADCDRIARELRDRFGPVPEAVQGLLELAALRALARHSYLQTLQGQADGVRLRFAQRREWPAEQLAALSRALGRRAGLVRFLDNGDIQVRSRSLTRAEQFWLLRTILEAAAALVPSDPLPV